MAQSTLLDKRQVIDRIKAMIPGGVSDHNAKQIIQDADFPTPAVTLPNVSRLPERWSEPDVEDYLQNLVGGNS